MFNINPVMVQDILPRAQCFKFFKDLGIVLFEAENMEYLIQTRS